MMAMYILFQGEAGLIGAPGIPGLTGSKVKKKTKQNQATNQTKPVSFYIFSFSTSFLPGVQYLHKLYLNYSFWVA